MTIPKITHQHYWSAVVQLTGNVKPHDICNKAIEIALAEQQESEYITAAQARELGFGAEYFAPLSEGWATCGALENFPETFEDGEVIKYRTINYGSILADWGMGL
jgi:hypothetical protein